jgi:hypothetical protein
MLADKDLNAFSQRVDSQTRAEFLSQLLENGKFADAVCIYRHNSSADRIGVFDKEIIDKLPPSVKWIAHNGESKNFFFYTYLTVRFQVLGTIKLTSTPPRIEVRPGYSLIACCADLVTTLKKGSGFPIPLAPWTRAQP